MEKLPKKKSIVLILISKEETFNGFYAVWTKLDDNSYYSTFYNLIYIINYL